MTENRSMLKISLDPFDLFHKWFEEAEKKEINDPNAMNLTTVSENLQPSSRVVLLKSFDKRGFTFFTNINSKKGKSILLNSRVALNFHWKSLLKQIRIEGIAHQINNEEADHYFDSRPDESKVGAWASNQSSELESREKLNENFLFYKKKFKNVKIPRPPYWTGFRVKPQLFEFWQQMSHRLHDRLEYEKINDKWIAKKLFP